MKQRARCIFKPFLGTSDRRARFPLLDFCGVTRSNLFTCMHGWLWLYKPMVVLVLYRLTCRFCVMLACFPNKFIVNVENNSLNPACDSWILDIGQGAYHGDPEGCPSLLKQARYASG